MHRIERLKEFLLLFHQVSREGESVMFSETVGNRDGGEGETKMVMELGERLNRWRLFVL